PQDAERQALPQADGELVVAFPGRVDRQDLWRKLVLLGAQHLAIGRGHVSLADELARAHRREHAAHADLEEVGLLAVVGCPLGNLLLVRAFHGAAVDLARLPPVLEPAEALTETPNVSRRVAEGDPYDLR